MEIDIKSVFKFFWDRKKIALYIVLVFFLLANIVFFIFTRPVYSIVGKVKMNNDASNSRIASYNDLLSSDTIISAAITKSEVNVDKSAIKNNISVSANTGSKIYSITLKYKSKSDGKEICEAIINEFISKVSSYDGNKAILYDDIVVGSKPINYSLVKNELLYIILGCMLSLGYVFICFYLDKRIKSNYELSKFTILGTILNPKSKNYNNNLSLIKTKIKLNNSGKVIFLNTPRNIKCRNDILALVNEFSKDSKVIFVDTNIRNNECKILGYSNLLTHYTDDIAKYIDSQNKYDIMECGTGYKETEVLLSSKNNQKLIDALKKKYDYVILYNSNVIDYSDSLILSKLCDCNYMLVEINKTDKRDLDKAIDVYEQINMKINEIIVINKEDSNTSRFV